MGLLIQNANILVKGFVKETYSLTDLGYFQAAVSLSQQYLQLFFTGIQLYFLPHLAEQKEDEAIGRESNKIYRTLLLLLTPSLLLLIVLSDWVIVLIYSREFMVAGELLRLSSFVFLFRLGSALFSSFIVIRNKLRFWIAMDTLYAVGYVVGSYLLLPTLGLNGPILMMVVMTVVNFLFIIVYISRTFGFRMAGQNILLLGVSVLLLLLCWSVYDHLPIWGNIALAVVLLSIYLAATITRAERRNLMRRLKHLRKGAAETEDPENKDSENKDEQQDS